MNKAMPGINPAQNTANTPSDARVTFSQQCADQYRQHSLAQHSQWLNSLQLNQNAIAQYTQRLVDNEYSQRTTWMFNGIPCTTREFANMIWPTDDSPEKTAFLLKYQT